jgi:hypothetical protein
VRVEKLGAHLEAYIQTLPTILVLRLCARFGIGPQCHVGRLPAELISTIGSFIIEPARVEALDTWSREFKCFDIKCDTMDDHFTQEEQHGLFRDGHLERCPRGRFCSFGRKVDRETAAKHREALLEYIEEKGSLYEPHDAKTRSWKEKVDMELSTW